MIRLGNFMMKIIALWTIRENRYVCFKAVHDIDLSVLPEYGLNYNTYFTEASDLAEFIFEAYQDGLDIICQCEYGESRSSGCAAAILEYFYQDGLSIFTDYRYYPNQVIYHKVFDALKKIFRVRK